MGFVIAVLEAQWCFWTSKKERQKKYDEEMARIVSLSSGQKHDHRKIGKTFLRL